MKRALKPYYDFHDGWNADAAPDSLKDSELMIADNCLLTMRGALSQRLGTIPFNAASYGKQVEQIIEWSKNDGSKIILAMLGNDLNKIAEDGTPTLLKTLASTNIGYFYLQDKFYFVDGNDFYVYDGTTVSSVVLKSGVTDGDLTPIKRCKYLLWHPKSFRIFAAGDVNDKAALYYSEPNEPDYFKSTSKLYPTTGDGPVHGLSMFVDAVIVYYQNSEWSWQGIDPATDATWSKVMSTQGTNSPSSIVLTPNTQTFLGAGGIYTISSAVLNNNVVMLTNDQQIVNLAKDKVTSVVRSIQHAETVCGIFDRYTERLMFAYGDDPANARNNMILVYDWRLHSFVRYTGLQVNGFCQRSNGDLLIASNNYILKANVGNKDWDVEASAYKAIGWKARTKPYHLGYPDHDKVLFRLFISAKQYKAESSSLNVDVITSYVDKLFSGISLDESFVWGEKWGTKWGWSDIIKKEIACKMKGPRFQVELSNTTIDQPITIYGLDFDFIPTIASGTKVK